MAFNITDFNNKWANFKEELRGFLNRSVDKDGDTMRGGLVLSKDPTEDMEAATKKYADDLFRFIPGTNLLGGVSYNYNSQLRSIALEGKPSSFVMYSETKEFTPSASGVLTLKGSIKGVNMGIPYWYYRWDDSHSSDVSATYDMSITYTLKYRTEGYDDIAIWSLENMSLYQASNDNTDIYQKTGVNFEAEIPVQQGKPGKFIYTQTCESFTSRYNPPSNSYHQIQQLPQCDINLKMSTGSPIFNLDYQEV